MNITQHKTEYVSSLTITDKSDIFSLLLSIDYFKDGSEKETATAYVYADALFGGAGEYKKEAFTDALKQLGGSISVSTHNGRLTFEVAGLVKEEKKIIKLFETLLSDPHFTASEVTNSKKLKVNQLELDKENAKELAHDMLRNAVYQKGSRGHAPDTDKLINAVGKVTPKDLKAFHKHLLSSYWYISVAGASSSLKLLELVQKTQQTVHTRTVEPSVSNAKKAAVNLQAVPSKQNIEFSIGGAVPLNRTDEAYPALLFGLGVLGIWGGFAGRLMSTVREEEGLTYGIYAQLAGSTVIDRGYWRIMTFFAPDKTEQGITATLRELKKIIAKGITKKELERFKTIYHTRFALTADSLTSALSRYHANMVAGGTIADIEKLENDIANLTQKEVTQALRQHIDMSALQICGAGPVEKLPVKLAKLL